jgi:hypothetical protein
MGWSAMTASRSSSPLVIMSVTMGVSMVPGQMAFERRVQAAEGGHRGVDHGGHLLLVGHVAGDGECLVACGGQLIHRAIEGVPVDVGEDDGGAGEGACGRPAHAGAGTGDQRDLSCVVVGRIHSITSTVT